MCQHIAVKQKNCNCRWKTRLVNTEMQIGKTTQHHFTLPNFAKVKMLQSQVLQGFEKYAIHVEIVICEINLQITSAIEN